MKKIKIAPSSELVTDLRCSKFKSEHKARTLKPPNTKAINVKNACEVSHGLLKSAHWHQPPERMDQLVSKLE